jgi:hypothetical protein
MNLADKLKRQLELQKKNQANLENPSARIAAEEEPAASVSIQTTPLQIQLGRLKHFQAARAGEVALPTLGKSAPLFEESDIRSNPAGQYVQLVFRHQTPLDSSEEWSKLRSLFALLQQFQLECPPEKVLFLDTETTGLSGGTGTCVFLVGIGFWGPEGLTVEQYFMRGFPEERAMLTALAERVEGVEALVTFNGKVFDVPLLETRFLLSRLAWRFKSIPHLDLLYPVRRLWKLRLKECSLGNAEQRILGIEREEDVPGHLIPHLYFNYLQTGKPRGIREILSHNRQDIVSLALLTSKAADILLALAPEARWLPEELLGAGRYFQALGREQLSLEFHRAALDAPMEEEVETEALIRLARLLKSREAYAEAVPLWEKLLHRRSLHAEEACESLAIYCEHHRRDLSLALGYAETGLREFGKTGKFSDRWHRRLARLQRKMGKHPQGMMEQD